MANRPKQIGTAAETAVVRHLRLNGFPNAERRALAGNADLGDILICRKPEILVAEVKAHKTFSDAQILAWTEETLTEERNAGAYDSVLIVKRPGKGPAQVGSWWAIQRWGNRLTFQYLDHWILSVIDDMGHLGPFE